MIERIQRGKFFFSSAGKKRSTFSFMFIYNRKATNAIAMCILTISCRWRSPSHSSIQILYHVLDNRKPKGKEYSCLVSESIHKIEFIGKSLMNNQISAVRFFLLTKRYSANNVEFCTVYFNMQ